MDIISITSIICITLFGLFGLFAVFTKHGNRKANKLLGIFFLLWAFDFLDGLLLLNGFYLEHPEFALWGESFVFLYGPLLYIYTLYIAKINTRFTWRSFLHLIPFLISLGINIISFQLLPKATKISIIESILDLKQPSEVFLFVLIIYVHFFSYILFSKKHIRKTVKKLNNFYSNHNISWLNKLLNSFLIILSLSVITIILQFYQSKAYFEIGLPIIIIVMGLFVASFIFKGLNSRSVFLTEETTIKYAGYRLELDEIEIISIKIINALEKDKLYLNSELNLEDLSNEININIKRVSQVINDKLNSSFFDLINYYRIEAAKDIFKKNEDLKLTVQEVMYEVGFNSKSSFNTQFKKRTGLTPSEFMKLK